MDFVVLDFETTGLRNEDRIIEIGYVWIQDGEIKAESSTLVNPGKPISRRITQITGITTEMVADAPEIHEVIEGFAKFLRGKMIVAHNASFDMRFLNNALRRANLDGVRQYVCTMRMFRGYKHALGIETPGAKLSDLTAYFGLHNDRAHRALEDAQVTGQAFQSMCQVVDWEDWVTVKA
jgi:DNA polymerase III epsilon subunit family exonuclease